jgi:hypothetical protein
MQPTWQRQISKDSFMSFGISRDGYLYQLAQIIDFLVLK